MLTENEAHKLADAVQSWLDFQILCERDVLLSEAYLAQPLGDFLISHHSGEIASEVNHPNVPTPKRGRPRQIDYVLWSKDSKDLISAIEAKWVSEDRQISRQRILDDVMRLERLRNDSERSVYRYFLVAGRSRAFGENFLKPNYESGNGYKPFVDQILPTDATDVVKHVRVDGADEGMRSFYEKYVEKYSRNGEEVLVPKSYKATLLTDKTDEKSRVMLWRIKSVSSRSEFRFSD